MKYYFTERSSGKLDSSWLFDSTSSLVSIFSTGHCSLSGWAGLCCILAIPSVTTMAILAAWPWSTPEYGLKMKEATSEAAAL